MSLYLYDNALKEKLSSVFPNVVDCNNEKALDYSEDDEATVRLPMISFWRLTNNIATNFYSMPAINRGRDVARIGNGSRTVRYKELPLVITYQIDIWSDRRYEVDEILKELLFYFMDEPHLYLKEDNSDELYDVHFNITDIDSDADVSSFDDRGILFRQTITIEIDNAPLINPVGSKIVKDFDIRMVVLNKKGDVSTDV